MNKYLTVLCLLAIGLTTSVFANYLVVTSDQVTVTSDGMFVTVDGLSLPVESLNIANNGYIVAIPQPQAAVCPRCRKDTYTPGRTCSNCGFPITNKKPCE